MNHQLHTLYRALIDYRKNTSEDRECKRQRTAISAANSHSDIIEIVRKNCVVEEDWIEAIEKGLVFIEKAIKEERQFIRSNGEIIPIEKVKRTSKDSVEHLARHSDLITRLPEEGDDLTPDSLYTVERLSDYTVYENRFLYMLLCYLRDFISIRYEKIVELTNTYKGKMSMNKTIVESNRRVVYEVKLEEEKKNDDYLRENNQAQDAIDRMMTIYKAVVFFLNTPLMIEVAKTPMLKPPITRTNVLKMNRNFKEAVSLYEYVSAYDKDGYEIKTEVKKLCPFAGILSDEIAETIELSSFLTYEYGLNIKDFFKRQYEKEEIIRKEEERRKYAEQLNKIRRHLKESGCTPEEYIAMLEKRIKDLEDREEDIIAAANKIEELNKEIDRLKDELRYARDKIEQLKQRIIEWQRKYEEDMEAERVRHAQEVARLKEEHANEIKALHEYYNSEIDRINKEHAEEIQALHQHYTSEIERINQEHAEEVQALHNMYISEIARLNDEHAKEVQSLHDKYASEIESLNQAHAKEVQSLHDKYTSEIESLNQAHAKEVQSLHDKYNAEITRLNKEHEKEVNTLSAQHQKEIIAINAMHVKEVKTMKTSYEKIVKKQEDDLNKWQEKYNGSVDKYNNTVDKHNKEVQSLKEKTSNMEKGLKSTIGEKTDEIKKLKQECERIEAQKAISDARLNAIRNEYGLMTELDDFSTKEATDEIEHQYRAFKKFFHTEWKQTKRKIKTEVFAGFTFASDKKLAKQAKAKEELETKEADKMQTQGDAQEIIDADDIALKEVVITKETAQESDAMQGQVVVEQETLAQEQAEENVNQPKQKED